MPLIHHTRPALAAHPSRSKGFTLVEVLVAALVLGIGLLGLAGIQSLGLRGNLSAVQRSTATLLASEMIDRLRANPEAVQSGSYNNQVGLGSANCLFQTCSVTDLADYELNLWSQDLAARLPGGVGAVCIDSFPDDGDPAANGCDGTGTTYAVKIWWDDNRTGDPQQYQRFVTSFQ